MNKCRVEFIYDAIGRPFPIGVTFDRKVLVVVKRQILKEAEEEYASIREIDEVLSVEHLGNLKRLKDTLDMLIPPESEELALLDNGG